MHALILTVLTTGLQQMANLGSGMLAAHLLLPEGRGELAAAQLWPTTLAYLVLFGLNDAVLYFSANRGLPTRQVFAGGLWLGVALSALAMIAGWWLVVPLAYADYRADVQDLARLMLWIIPCHILGMVFQEMLRGHLRMGAWNTLRIALGVGYVGFILLFLLFGRSSVADFAIAYLLAHILPMAAALIIGLRSGWGGLAAPVAAYRALLHYGARLHVASVVSMVNSRIDQMLIATTLDATALGLYVVAVTLSQVTATLASSVTMVAFPRACAAPDRAAQGEIIGQYLRLTLAMMLGSTIILWLLAPLALRILFGPAFTEAAPVVRLLILGVVPMAARDFFILAFKAADKALALSKNEVATLAVNGGLLALLVPSLGLTGAALAFIAVRWVSALYMGWLVQRELGHAMGSLLLPRRSDLDLLRQAIARLRRR